MVIELCLWKGWDWGHEPKPSAIIASHDPIYSILATKQEAS